jgi:hypothetical protein
MARVRVAAAIGRGLIAACGDALRFTVGVPLAVSCSGRLSSPSPPDQGEVSVGAQAAFGACPSERAMRARVDVALMGRVLRAQRGFELDESAVWDGPRPTHKPKLSARE